MDAVRAEVWAVAHDVFISYSTVDVAFAEAACEALEQAGHQCWMAPRDVRPAKDYGEEIVRGIEASRLVLLCLSASANASEMVRRELEIAASCNKPILQCRLQDVKPSRKLRYYVAGKQWVDVFAGLLDEQLKTVIRAVRGLMEEAGSSSDRPHAPQEEAVVIENDLTEAMRRREEEALRVQEIEREIELEAKLFELEPLEAVVGDQRRLWETPLYERSWLLNVLTGISIASLLLATVVLAARYLRHGWSGSGGAGGSGVLVDVVGPETMDLCGSDRVRISVTNTTGRTVRSIEVGWSRQEGWSLQTEEGEEITGVSVPELGPGETEVLERWVKVREAGRYAFGGTGWTAKSGDNSAPKAETIDVKPVEIVAGRSKLRLSWDEKPESVLAGEACRFVVKVESTGEAPAVDGEVRLVLPQDMEVVRTEPGARVDGSAVVWKLTQGLEKGRSLEFAAIGRREEPGEVGVQAYGRATCAETAELTASIQVLAAGPATEQGSVPPQPDATVEEVSGNKRATVPVVDSKPAPDSELSVEFPGMPLFMYAGQEYKLPVLVTNKGRGAEEVTLAVRSWAGAAISSEPASVIVKGDMTWQLGLIGPGESRTVMLKTCEEKPVRGNIAFTARTASYRTEPMSRRLNFVNRTERVLVTVTADPFICKLGQDVPCRVQIVNLTGQRQEEFGLRGVFECTDGAEFQYVSRSDEGIEISKRGTGGEIAFARQKALDPMESRVLSFVIRPLRTGTIEFEVRLTGGALIDPIQARDTDTLLIGQ